MPTRFNLDHQYAIHGDGSATAPGEPHDFTPEEIEAGLAGQWSDEDPRAGLTEEQEFKRLRDTSRADLDQEASSLGLDPSQYPNKQAVIEAIRAAKSSPSPDETPDETSDGDTNDPAETGENKE